MEPWRECCRPSICSTAVTVSMLHVFVLQSWKQFTRTFQDQIAAATTARCSENFLLLLTYLLRSSLGWSEHHDMKIVMSVNITQLQSIIFMEEVFTRRHKTINIAGPDRLSSGRNLSPGLFIWSPYIFPSFSPQWTKWLEILWNLRGEEREILEAATDILNHNNTLVQCLVIVDIMILITK